MTVQFPLALEDFFDGLRLSFLRFELSENMENSETAGGEILPSATGPRLWEGEVQISPKTIFDFDRVISKIDLLRQPGRSFFIGDPLRAYGELDPDGAILGANTVTVQSVGANNRELRLQGGPDDLVISDGDHLSIASGSNPVVHDYFRVVTGGTFNDAYAPPRTDLVEVQPFLPPGLVVGTQVRLKRPFLKAVYVPGSYQGGARRPGIKPAPVKFGWRQTLR